MRRLHFVILLTLATLSGFTQPQKVINWASDIEFLKTELPFIHKDLFFQLSKSDFETNLDNISSHLSNLSDFEISVKLQQIIAKIGDSHTMVGYTQFLDSKKILPFQFYWFSDGLYVMHTIKEYEKLLGSKILKINDFPIQVIVDSLSTLITMDNQALVKSNIPRMISFLQLLEYFGFSKGMSLKLEVESTQGKSMISEIKPSDMDPDHRISFKPDSSALCWQNQGAFFTDKYFENDAVYYIQYNRCWSKELEERYGSKDKAVTIPSFIDFQYKVFDIIRNKTVNKLIFDMRFNGGGNSMLGTGFVSKLSGYDISNQDKKIYVVVGRETFSAAIINAMDFKENTRAIFVGEETGGKPNHFGEVKRFRLPSSGLPISYSTKFFTITDEDLNTITPDVILDLSFSDYKRGIDPVYEWIIRQK